MAVVARRRDQLRAATVAEIKQIARRYLVQEGPAGISRRAIARDMGMSAPALARYFPRPDTLITALAVDAYEDLRGFVEQARDGVPASDPMGRFLAAARAFRTWALAHPAEFQLAFGKPFPSPQQRAVSRQEPPDTRDVVRRTHVACGDAGLGFGAVFTQIVAELWVRHPFPTPVLEGLDPALVTQVEPLADEINQSLPEGGHLPVGAVVVLLSCWTRLYGLVAIEVFGHQQWALRDAEPMFELELQALARQLQPA